MYITFASTKANKAQPTLALRPRGDINKSPNQGYQWPQNRTCVCVRQKFTKKTPTKTKSSIQVKKMETKKLNM